MALRNRGYGYILIYLIPCRQCTKVFAKLARPSRRRTEVTVPILHDFHPLPFRMMKVYSSAAPYSQTKMSKKNTAAALLPYTSRPLPQHLLLKNMRIVFFFQ